MDRWDFPRDDSRPAVRQGSPASGSSRSPIPSPSETAMLSSVKNNKPIIPLQSRRAFTDPQSYEPSDSPGLLRSAPRHAGVAQSQESHDPHDSPGPLRKARSIKPNVNIKPLLRMMSRDDAPSTSIDLSRSSLEYEGLGIYTNFDRQPSQADRLSSNSVGRTAPSLHYRSTSGASQFSSMTSPSAAAVYTNRDVGGRFSYPGERSALTDSDGLRRMHVRHLSLQASPGTSQAASARRHSLGYPRDNTGSIVDSPSPVSRSSLDFVFNRPKQRVATDPISRAATVQAARKAFDEKEAEKTRRFESQQVKAEERQMRRKEKPFWQRPSTDDQAERAEPIPAPENANQEGDTSEKPPGAEKPAGSDPESGVPALPRRKSELWKNQSKNTWVLFLTWLRTKLFKLNRRLRRL